MEAQIEIRDEDITQFLSDVIELGGFHKVDKSPDRLIRLADGEVETVTHDGVKKTLAIYGSRSQDALIVNPFSEGEANSTRNSWFYLSRNVIVSGIIKVLMKKLLEIGAASHKKGNKDQPDMIAIKLLESDITSIDEKMLKEFDQISKKPINFFTIHYNTSSHKGEVKSVIFNEVQRKAYPGIRVKSWAVFESLLGKILSVRKLEDFDYQPTSIGIPMFESFSHILVNVYKRLIPSLPLLSGFEEKWKDTAAKVGEIESHLKYLAEYYTKAKYVASIVNSAAPVSSTGPMPWNSSAAAPVGAINTSTSTPVGSILTPQAAMAPQMSNAPAPAVGLPQPQGLTSFLSPMQPQVYGYPQAQVAPAAPVGVSQATSSFFDNPTLGGGYGPISATQPSFDPSQVNADNPFARP